jgi:hypothetical protein
MLAQNRKVLWCGVASMVVGCAVAVFAQRANPTDTDGSFAALVAEIRQLRVAIEQSTRSQTQTQALAVYLSTQQSRLGRVVSIRHRRSSPLPLCDLENWRFKSQATTMKWLERPMRSYGRCWKIGIAF